MDLRRGAQKAVDKILEVLEANKRDITTSEEIAQVSHTGRGDRCVSVEEVLSECLGRHDLC